jgi:Fe-S-cluster containining protein
MSEPWYKNGLRFQCTRCGHCCTGAPGYVWVNEAEIQALADYLGQPAAEVEALYTWQASRKERSLREKANGDCIFWDANAGCTVYPVRPRQCRTWPFWERNVATPEAWAQTCQICPGSGKGPLIPAEEITARLKAIKL